MLKLMIVMQQYFIHLCNMASQNHGGCKLHIETAKKAFEIQQLKL